VTSLKQFAKFETARKRAARGAAYLDQKFGGKRWARDIRLKELDIDSSCNCVRGQLESAGRIGDYEMLNPRPSDPNSADYYPKTFGMHEAGEYGEYTEAWKDEIRKRR
jgi:hypothetical protein